jgi:RNA-binding protein
MSLAEKQLRFLRGKAHALKPVIQIGNPGLTEGVVAETQVALETHELIKVRVRGAEREARDQMLAELCKRTSAEQVTRIGHVAVLYRQKKKLPRMVLPDA